LAEVNQTLIVGGTIYTFDRVASFLFNAIKECLEKGMPEEQVDQSISLLASDGSRKTFCYKEISVLV